MARGPRFAPPSPIIGPARPEGQKRRHRRNRQSDGGATAGSEPEQCEGQTVCIGGICSDYPEPENSDDFLEAQAWLQFLNEATKDGTGNDPTTIFSGEAVYCRKKGFGFNINFVRRR